MEDEKNLTYAKMTFQTLCNALEHEDWKYEKDESQLSVTCGVRGEDIPIELTMKVDAERMVVLLLSPMPFSIPEDKRLDIAVAVSVINECMVHGSFDYDVTEGNLFFRMTNSFVESVLGEEVFRYMLYCSCKTIDEYNDQFLMLSKGIVSLEQFFKKIENEEKNNG